MKKKKSIDIKVGKAILIICFVIVGLVLIVFTIHKVFFGEPHFKITKEECWNETKVIGTELISIDKTSCSYTKEMLNCLECSKHCISEEEYYANCNKSVLKCRVYYEYSLPTEYAKEEYTSFKENWRDITKVEQICEPVEVEIIQTEFDAIYYFDNGEIIEKKCDENTCSYCYEGNIGCSYSNSGLSKQELTRDWLKENCACVEYEDKECGVSVFKKECWKLCLKYKCEFKETYFVEVWN